MKHPLFVFEVTPRCNLACAYCYNVWKTKGEPYPRELSIEEIEILADSVLKAHPVSVTLTGGEPLLRKDIRDIVSTFRKRGIPVGIATNGVLLDRDTAESLKEAGADWIEISVPSITGKGYSDLTGTDGFDDAKRALLAAASTGIRFTVSHIITSLNYTDAGRVVDLAFAFSAAAVALNRFVPGGAGFENMYLLPSLKQLDSSLRNASRRSLRSPGMTVYAAIPVEDCLLRHSDYPGIKFGSCICGAGKWAVSPSGELRVCEQSSYTIGSLFDKSFEELSISQFVEEFRQSNMRSDCSSCSSRNVCGGGCRFLQAIPTR